ncbi:hypothetical protein ACHAW5_002664 [Stephanodiscus triporus]|uniref:Dihydrolipoamide acetyltransferase component of pyruvate dehydrogenase complex n=1 Tax=Stephanodiscus triporus TaxID=2934178 RepID=A0ABD3MG87_9STRA
MLSTSSARRLLLSTRQSASARCDRRRLVPASSGLSSLSRPSDGGVDRDGRPSSSRRRGPIIARSALPPGIINPSPRSSSVRWFASAEDLPYHIVVGMPALSPTMESGTISKWNVAEGDSFSAGDSLAVVETDKASMDFEAQDDGVVARLLVTEGGGEVRCGAPIMVTVEDVADVGAFANFSASAGGEGAPTTTTATTPVTETETVGGGARRPSIRFLGKEGWAAKLSSPVTPPGVVGSSSTPIAAAASSLVPSPPATAAVAAAVVPNLRTYAPETVTTVPPHLYSDSPASNMRKVISKRLTQSKSTVPHFYTSIEVSLDGILALRKVLAKDFDAKVSVNDFIIKASAMALRDVPEVNATYDPVTRSQRTFDGVDVSVAVATPTGLITPIIPSTSGLSLAEIGSRMKDLASRARDGNLKPEEYQGGTFCISNLGMFGISEFSAVVNPPQGAILAVGGGERRVVPGRVDTATGEKGRPAIATIMTARLSADRRVVDEATAALFMGALKEYLTQPKLMIL